MTSRQRLLAAFRNEQPDRVPIHVRGVPVWNDQWVTSRHRSYQSLIDSVREKCDLCASWGCAGGFFLSGAPVDQASETKPHSEDFDLLETRIQTPLGELTRTRYVSRKGHPGLHGKSLVETPEDARRFLSLPYKPLEPDAAGFFKLVEQIGDSGLVLAGYGMDAIGCVADLMGSETLAIWSIEERELVLQLLDVMTQRICDLVKALLAQGVGPVFATLGQEYAIRPLLPPRDFNAFCADFDARPIDLIHDAGGLVHIHCHGAMSDVLETFAEMGADCLHPLEAPPMGDVTLAEAKARVGDRICLEGNIQIGDIYSADRAEIIRQVEEAIETAATGGGYILCATASPYTPDLDERTVSNYLAMIDTARAVGTYP